MISKVASHISAFLRGPFSLHSLGWLLFVLLFLCSVLLSRVVPLLSLSVFLSYFTYLVISYMLLLKRRNQSAHFKKFREIYKNSFTNQTTFGDEAVQKKIDALLINVYDCVARGKTSFSGPLLDILDPVQDHVFVSRYSTYYNQQLADSYVNFANRVIKYFKNEGFDVTVYNSFGMPRWIELRGWDL